MMGVMMIMMMQECPNNNWRQFVSQLQSLWGIIRSLEAHPGHRQNAKILLVVAWHQSFTNCWTAEICQQSRKILPTPIHTSNRIYILHKPLPTPHSLTPPWSTHCCHKRRWPCGRQVTSHVVLVLPRYASQPLDNQFLASPPARCPTSPQEVCANFEYSMWLMIWYKHV